MGINNTLYIEKEQKVLSLREINDSNDMDIIKALLSRSDASGSKSTILQPLTWFIAILLATLALLFKIQAPNWICYTLTGIIIVIVLLFGFAYVYCLFVDRDALRSESFSIRKMEIEKGIMLGDSSTGLIERPKTNMNLIGTNNEEEGL